MQLRSYLQELKIRRRSGFDAVVIVRQVDSTNLLARRILDDFLSDEKAPPETLVLALEQTRGRGREGRRWSSPPGLGVYASLLLPVTEAGVLYTLPMLAGTGLCRALANFLSHRVQLKWPNDLLVRGRKIGGVLIETVARAGEVRGAIVGFGVNWGQTAGQLPTARATSLQVEEGRVPPLQVLTGELVRTVQQELRHLGDLEYAVSAYADSSLHKPGERLRCRIGGKEVEGTFLGFDRRGFLRLASGGEEHLLTVGEAMQP